MGGVAAENILEGGAVTGREGNGWRVTLMEEARAKRF